MPVHILLSKINHPIAFSYQRSALHATPRKADHGCLKAVLVGLGRVELPTSPLSGVRSSHLSYRPARGSLTWWSWSGSNRRPPECKSGALPAELQPLHPAALRPEGINRGQLDAGIDETSSSTASVELSYPQWRSGADSPDRSKPIRWLWSGTAIPYSPAPYTLARGLSGTPPTFSLRKEVIQPQVLLRLPCYDFTPIMNHTLGRCLPCGSACRLLVQSTFVM